MHPESSTPDGSSPTVELNQQSSPQSPSADASQIPSTDNRNIPISKLLSRKRRRNGLKLMPSTVKRLQESKKKRIEERTEEPENSSNSLNPSRSENDTDVDGKPPASSDDVHAEFGKDLESGEADEISEDFVAPQVTLDEDGNIIIDQSSLVVSANAVQGEDGHEINTVEIPSSEANITSASFSKRDTAIKWTSSETGKFYEALRTFGTDFTLMQRLFPSRSRRMLKAKFKREERDNLQRVEQALNGPRIPISTDNMDCAHSPSTKNLSSPDLEQSEGPIVPIEQSDCMTPGADINQSSDGSE